MPEMFPFRIDFDRFGGAFSGTEIVPADYFISVSFIVVP